MCSLRCCRLPIPCCCSRCFVESPRTKKQVLLLHTFSGNGIVGGDTYCLAACCPIRISGSVSSSPPVDSNTTHASLLSWKREFPYSYVLRHTSTSPAWAPKCIITLRQHTGDHAAARRSTGWSVGASARGGRRPSGKDRFGAR